MTTFARVSAPALFVLAAACAGRQAASPASAPSPAAADVMRRAATAQPPAPKDIDPVGTYDVETVAQGSAVKFTTKIVRNADGSFGGTVASAAYGDMAISGLKVSGPTLSFTVTTADGTPVYVSFTLDGASVSGEWAAGNDGWKVTGTKRP